MPPNPRLIRGRPTTAAGLNSTLSGLASLVPARQGRMRNLLDLVRQIRDYNADASKAVSNILRLANSGWEVHVYGVDGETPDPEGQALIDDLISPLSPRIGVEYGGGLNVLIDMAHLTIATQGAVAGEIELTDNLVDIADVIVVNPWNVDFERDENLRWIPGVRALNGFTPLHPLQFKHIPLDPEPDDPRGRSPFWSALDIVFFQMEVLRDLKAAAHFAGYPRIDISVAFDAVYKAVEATRPDLLEPGQADNLRLWLDEYLGDIQDYIEDLNPDDAFIHYDSVTSQYTLPTGKTIDIKELISTIDAQIVSGLKQLPILLGRNEGATTTHATVQWQVFVKELQTFQRVSANLLNWALSFALRIWGRQGIVKLEFEPLRTSDREADARALLSETQAHISMVEHGWETDDEAAMAILDHNASGTPQAQPDNGNNNNNNNNNNSPARGEDIHEHLSEGEDVSQLPYWQQELYAQGELAMWRTYQEQTRRAWNRLDRLVNESRGDQDQDQEPETSISNNGNGRHKPNIRD